MAGLGAAAGLAVATQIADPVQAARIAPWLAGVGALAGLLLSFKALPDAPRCVAPRILRGCGGQSTIQDTAGNSRPKRPCWAHPGGKPKRIVNLAIVLGEIAFFGLALVAVVAVRS